MILLTRFGEHVRIIFQFILVFSFDVAVTVTVTVTVVVVVCHGALRRRRTTVLLEPFSQFVDALAVRFALEFDHDRRTKKIVRLRTQSRSAFRLLVVFSSRKRKNGFGPNGRVGGGPLLRIVAYRRLVSVVRWRSFIVARTSPIVFSLGLYAGKLRGLSIVERRRAMFYAPNRLVYLEEFAAIR